MVTIAATSGIQFNTVAELVKWLGNLGVNDGHLAQTLRHPGRVQELAEVLKAAPPKLPNELDADKCVEFIAQLFPASYDSEGRTPAATGYPLYEEERRWLEQKEQMLYLLGLLTTQQLTVILERSGLDGREAECAEVVGRKLCLTKGQVNAIRGRARMAILEEATRLIQKGRHMQGGFKAVLPR